jgi:hypothetical protein
MQPLLHPKRFGVADPHVRTRVIASEKESPNGTPEAELRSTDLQLACLGNLRALLGHVARISRPGRSLGKMIAHLQEVPPNATFLGYGLSSHTRQPKVHLYNKSFLYDR